MTRESTPRPSLFDTASGAAAKPSPLPGHPLSSTGTSAVHPLSVQALNDQARDLVEHSLGTVWVCGEISNLVKASSGHWYFTLKDDKAQVRCTMWRGRNRLLQAAPNNGDRVAVQARPTIYAVRGEFQLTVEHLQADGAGALQQAYDALRLKLAAEGLFDEARKRPLPLLPRRVLLITSAAGAAVRDMIAVLGRRWPALPIMLLPAPVQGPEAAPALVERIEQANREQLGDLILLGRGGGSIEDLWAFNEEIVVRAVAQSRIPVISAVGHETDTTLCDFAADLRAPTPSVAAEKACPDWREWHTRYRNAETRAVAFLKRQLRHERQRLLPIERSLARPDRHLAPLRQRIDELELRALAAMRRLLQQRVQVRAHLHARLRHPGQKLARHGAHQRDLHARLLRAGRAVTAGPAAQLAANLQTLVRACERSLQQDQQRFALILARLDTISPLATLSRGYSITLDAQSRPLTTVSRLKAGDQVETRLASGRFSSRVEAVFPEGGELL